VKFFFLESAFGVIKQYKVAHLLNAIGSLNLFIV